jgi:hypothetical protein
MQPPVASTSATDLDAVEFVRFCHRRRRVGWPELYDEMCAVAARGLYRGYSADDLGVHGIRFGLFDMPALAALTREVVAAEAAARRPMQVAIHQLPAERDEVALATDVSAATDRLDAAERTVAHPEADADSQPAVIDVRIVTASGAEPVPALHEASAATTLAPTVSAVEARPAPGFGQRFRMVPAGA